MVNAVVIREISDAVASEQTQPKGKDFPKLTADLAEVLGPLTRKHFADRAVGSFDQQGIHSIYNMDMTPLNSELYTENPCYRSCQGCQSCP
tara:strand:+ start:97 stop:369 length:273 start_codon:yes stop_codon:yes gene_type:complete